MILIPGYTISVIIKTVDSFLKEFECKYNSSRRAKRDNYLLFPSKTRQSKKSSTQVEQIKKVIVEFLIEFNKSEEFIIQNKRIHTRKSEKRKWRKRETTDLNLCTYSQVPESSRNKRKRKMPKAYALVFLCSRWRKIHQPRVTKMNADKVSLYIGVKFFDSGKRNSTLYARKMDIIRITVS